MITDLKRQKMEKVIYDTFDALDPTHANTNKYKEMFSRMTNNQFDVFFKKLFADPNLYLILNVCDYQIDLKMEDIENAAKVLNVPLFEKVAFPNINSSLYFIALAHDSSAFSRNIIFTIFFFHFLFYLYLQEFALPINSAISSTVG